MFLSLVGGFAAEQSCKLDLESMGSDEKTPLRQQKRPRELNTLAGSLTRGQGHRQRLRPPQLLFPRPGLIHFCYPTDNKPSAECECEKEEDRCQKQNRVPQLTYHWTLSFLRLLKGPVRGMGLTTNLVQMGLAAQEVRAN